MAINYIQIYIAHLLLLIVISKQQIIHIKRNAMKFSQVQLWRKDIP